MMHFLTVDCLVVSLCLHIQKCYDRQLQCLILEVASFIWKQGALKFIHGLKEIGCLVKIMNLRMERIMT